MKINFKALVAAEMHKAMLAYHRFLGLYASWFVFYGDPLSDDIMLDIHEQAKAWAMKQVGITTAL